MTTEEKAQRYDEISKEVKDFFDGKQKMYSDVKQTLNYLFPELKESKDERIRKKLISLVKNWDKGGIVPKYTSDANDIKQILTWLEKQGEQRKQLIDKACDVLVNCIEDFMSRRMEIWDEECKKQTLENIRKTLEE